jgi:hypothetical protein
MNETLSCFLGKKLDTSGSALGEWYNRVLAVSLSEMSDGDLARIVRQSLALPNTLPYAFKRLLAQPLAGDLYEGELAVAIAKIQPQFWSEHPGLSQNATVVLRYVEANASTDIAIEIRSLTSLIT